jgi:hypothetical protein
MPDLSLTLQTNPILFVVLAFLIAVVSYFVYRVTVPPIPGALKTALVFLRAAGLIAVLMFFFEPVLTVATRTETPARVALLVDDSKSMQLADGAGNRTEIFDDVLNHPAFERLYSQNRLSTVRFAAEASHITGFSPDSFQLDGEVTNMNDAMLKLQEIRDLENVQFAVMISDGNYNIGPRPVYAAERIGIPLFTIGIGDTVAQKDLLIDRVMANEIAYLNTEAPVDVRIRSSGFGGERVAVSLSNDESVVDRKTITLDGGTAEYDVAFTFEPEGEGVQRYTVRVDELPGEVTYENNRASFYVRVLDQRIRVVLIAGAPSADAVFVRRALDADESVTVNAAFQQPKVGFIGEEPTVARLREADLIMLLGYPTTASDPAIVRNILAAVREVRTPILFFESPGADVRSVEEILPVTVEQVYAGENQTFGHVVDDQFAHTIFRVDDDRLTGWNALPPVYRTTNRYAVRPGSEKLMTHRMQNVSLEDPFLVIRSVAGSKSAALLGYGIWRWRMLGRGAVDGEHLYDTFVTNLIRWLTTEDTRDRVRIVASREQYVTGEAIEFTGQVYDEQYRPLSNAEIRVRITSEGGDYETILTPRGHGRYEGVVNPLPEGEYRYAGVAMFAGTEIGEDDGRFTVGERNIEFRDTRMNVQVLRQLAAITGGAFMLPGDTEALDELLRTIGEYESRHVTDRAEFQIWNLPLVLIVLILFFSLEWFLRKRNGLL